MRRITWIESCPSTSRELSAEAPHGAALAAREQTAGRGQRGNSWEAEPGKNLTLSLMLRPDGLHASRQFELSEAVALGVADFLDSLGLEGVCVKWPNDIYVGDRKICGILIENTLGSSGAILRAVAGIGVNINQTRFRSDAPNPVSVRQLTGKEYDLEELAEELVARILARLGRDNHPEYRRRLWRGEGEWPWRDGRGEFRAAIGEVLPDGRLELGGRLYRFKEVSAVF